MNLEQFLNQIPNLNYRDIHLHNLIEILQNGAEPSDYYRFINSGAYKEVYKLNGNYVIKFCSFENPTEEECKLSHIAQQELKENNIFLPVYCYYFKENEQVILKEILGEEYYDEELEEECRYPITAVSLEIQPIIECTLDEVCNWNSEYDEELLNATSAQILEVLEIWNQYNPLFLFAHNDKAFWVYNIGRIYGAEGLNAIAQFFVKYHITDWHSENIGWIKQDDKLLPVIFDYFSNLQ